MEKRSGRGGSQEDGVEGVVSIEEKFWEGRPEYLYSKKPRMKDAPSTSVISRMSIKVGER